jgi:peptidoglycan/LPS O-acetylase OafA/YrhL
LLEKDPQDHYGYTTAGLFSRFFGLLFVLSVQRNQAHNEERDMSKQILQKLAIGATLLALVTPAFAQTGTDPEPQPGVVHAILAYIGLA